MKPSDAQLDIAPGADPERAKGERRPPSQDQATYAVGVLERTKERIRSSLRAWHGGTGKAGPAMQRGTVQVREQLPDDRLAELYAAPECGCGSHVGVECPDCGVLACAGQGHGRHVCADAAGMCLRCEGSGAVAHSSQGVPWPEWLRRLQRKPSGELVAGLLRHPPTPAAVAAVGPVSCPRCGGRQ